MKSTHSQRNPAALSALGCVRCAQVLSLFVASDFLHNHQVSLLSYVFLLCAISGSVLCTLDNIWARFRQLSRGQVLILLLNGTLVLCSMLLYAFGLKFCGPYRSILLEFFDRILPFIPILFVSLRSLPVGTRRGAILMSIALLVLIMTPEQSVHDLSRVAPADGNTADIVNKAAAVASPPPAAAAAASASASGTDGSTANAHSFQAGVYHISEGVMGLIALVASVALTLFRKTRVRRVVKSFGSERALDNMSLIGAAIVALPILVVRTVVAIVDAEDGATGSTGSIWQMSEVHYGGFGFFATIVYIGLCTIVARTYVQPLSSRVASDAAAKVDVFSAVLCAAIVDVYRGDGRLTFWTGLAALLVCAGVYYAVSPSGSSGLPVFAQKADKSLAGPSQLRLMYKHVMENPDTMRIFVFLMINFAFMFVELGYGFLTNSLGLISDAGHMLFDCAALAIGLYASYISKIKPNRQFTYGYGRYEVVSGFVNGVFLVFIGFFILVESIERVFETPDIHSDNLILVSVLGFIVNIIGLCFFHDHHGHSHGGGHGHSHGGHGHSHGGGGAHDDEHDDDDECDHSAGHEGHGHSHGSDEKHAHAHAHAHSHSHGASPVNHGHSHGSDTVSAEVYSHASFAAVESDDDMDHRDLNTEGIFLHILADTLGSVGVIVSSLLIHYFQWYVADAICSIAISILIVASVIPLLRDATRILLQRTPPGHVRRLKRLLRKVTAIPGVLGYRQPHFWDLIDNTIVGTLHVHIAEDADAQHILSQVSAIFHDAKNLGLAHFAVQVEKEAFLNTLDPHSRIMNM
jgi:cation diffusion facilitator family transporter